jgi:hypothetical protein
LNASGPLTNIASSADIPDGGKATPFWP